MIRQCAWCGETMDATPSSPSRGPVSHGICAACERELTAELGTPLQRFVSTLSAPVLLVDVERGGRVRSANRRALDATAQDAEGLRDRLLGDVFECANASLPGGCGRTVHCSGCTIRGAVESTWETGQPEVRRPATLHAEGRDAPVELLISTERVGDRVVLAVEWADQGADRASPRSEPSTPTETGP